jgi:acetoin utilization protein AcuB
MLVKERMTRNPITAKEDTSLDEALRIMKREKIRRLPILDKGGRLVGIVSERDLLAASPSQATTLSKYEIGYLISKIQMKDIMTKDVITVCEDCPLEEAARTMADNSIGGVPVMRDETLVGIVTETDLFKVFLEMLGAREQGVRITIRVAEGKGVLCELASHIAELGGNIVTVGTFLGDDPTNRLLTIKVQDIKQEDGVAIVAKMDAELVDIRET